jgi:hydroxymethylbilane synthase
VTVRLGTRGSALALVQARTVAALLAETGVHAELVIITTTGDRLQRAPLADAGGKRLFVKEIEEALVGGDIDLAVHSAKDMPAVLPDGLAIAAVLPREDPRDAFVLPGPLGPADLRTALTHLGETPTIGTGSVRRISQLTALVPQATFIPVRGNVDTRIRRLDEGAFNAIILAAAGMRRLGLSARISAPIPFEDCVPAPGQGIVAIETRADDNATRRAVGVLNDATAAVSLTAERAVVAALGGGCRLPLGAVTVHGGDDIQVYGLVASVDGRRVVKRDASGPASEADAIGRRLAEALSAGGATEILDGLRQ